MFVQYWTGPNVDKSYDFKEFNMKTDWRLDENGNQWRGGWGPHEENSAVLFCENIFQSAAQDEILYNNLANETLVHETGHMWVRSNKSCHIDNEIGADEHTGIEQCIMSYDGSILNGTNSHAEFDYEMEVECVDFPLVITQINCINHIF